MKALDYLSHGLPIIGSELPSVREVAGHAGIFIAPGDADALVRASVSLLDNSPAYHKAAEASRARAGELLWSERARLIIEFASAS